MMLTTNYVYLNWNAIREFGVRKSFVKEVKIVLFIFPAVGRLFNMAGFTLFYVPLN
jgi:hypothetical protein